MSNKSDIIAKVAELSMVPKDTVGRVINSLLGVITEEIKAGEKVVFTGFGSFSTTERKARTGRNPRTGAALNIPACKIAQFKPGKDLKDAVK